MYEYMIITIGLRVSLGADSIFCGIGKICLLYEEDWYVKEAWDATFGCGVVHEAYLIVYRATPCVSRPIVLEVTGTF